MGDKRVELFISDRQPEQAVNLMAKLRALGIEGRDAAYLATVLPPREPGTPEMARYLSEFELMVGPAERQSAAELVGLVRVEDGRRAA
jgi:hypothetical protein